jgi:steroid 5-alpha reductase family enzyme
VSSHMENVSFVQVNVVPARLHPALSFRDYASLGLIAGSFVFEVIADRQKTAWRRAQSNKEHEEKFITSGLWSISRHPKYSSPPVLKQLRSLKICLTAMLVK